MRKDHREGETRVRSALLLCLALLMAVVACDGDTLIDAPADDDDEPGPGEVPVVAVVRPGAGAEVLAGQRVPIRVTASDDEGISEIEVLVRGVVRTSITRTFAPPVLQAVLDTAVTLPANTVGTLEIQATARDVREQSATTEVSAFEVLDVDRTAPTASVAASVPGRVEGDDTLRVTVTGRDNEGGSGVTEVGATVLVLRGNDTLSIARTTSVSAAAGSVERTFELPVAEVALRPFPDSLDLRVFGFARDGAGLCGGSVEGAGPASFACLDLDVGGEEVTVVNAVAPSRPSIVVDGSTTAAPRPGTLADLVVDTLRSRVYVSNLSENRIHSLDAEAEAFVDEVLVASQPWGLALNRAGDSLLVANSGGTSLSFVGLLAFQEDLQRRFVTKNAPLFEITKDSLESGIRYDGEFIDFSDRPQYLAEDLAGRILYSTRPTRAAGSGTVRVVEHQPGWEAPESRILLLEGDIDGAVEDPFAIAHVDSITVFGSLTGDDMVEIYDHQPGFPDQLVRSGILPIEEAISEMIALGSDIAWGRGTWNIERLAFRDTTYVTASGDHRWVAFGEGGPAEIGRVVMWDGAAAKIHRRLLVADLVSNASEEVRGLAMNHDGSLGAARGAEATSFFATDLRLQGSVAESVEEGAGVALHPDHPSDFTPAMPSGETTLAFVASGESSIRLLDTSHFTLRGEIPIRDRVVGVLRAGPPLPTDNGGQGRSCTGDDCVVVKLYGLTDTGGVLVVDVLRRHIEPAG